MTALACLCYGSREYVLSRPVSRPVSAWNAASHGRYRRHLRSSLSGLAQVAHENLEIKISRVTITRKRIEDPVAEIRMLMTYVLRLWRISLVEETGLLA
jgi:hypothetical protein